MVFCVIPGLSLMKRFFVTILTILYYYYSIGATIHEHYCMGEVVEISLFSASEKKCTKCGIETHPENNDCCKDVQVVVKSNEDHISSSYVHFIRSNFEIIPPVFFAGFNEIYFDKIAATYNASAAHSPPLKHVPIYIQIQNFRI